jgi:hypothetical protein
MTMHTITEFYTGWFSICPNITLTLPTIAKLKASRKKIMIKIELVCS